MAFNLARYNLVPFNVDQNEVFYLITSGAETVSVSIGSALEIFPDVYGYERVDEETSGTPVKFIRALGAETVDELAEEGQMSVILSTEFTEEVTAELELSADVSLVRSGAETITGDLNIFADIYVSTSSGVNVTSVDKIAANIKLFAEGYELVSESASLEAIDIKTCVLTLTLKPGQRLIIDANTYNVLLDGENAIDVQSGDWIDELSRETTDITISAASGVGNLSASIVYTERYL